MYHVHQLSALTISLWAVQICLSLLRLYRIHIRSKKWYHELFFHFLDVTVVKSWLMHCRGVTGNEGKLRLREFKMILANSLMRLANQHQQRGEGHLWLMLRSNLKQKKDVVQQLQFNQSHSTGWSRSLASLYGKWQKGQM